MAFMFRACGVTGYEHDKTEERYPKNHTHTWRGNKIDVELPLGKLRTMDELETQNIAVEVK